MSSKSIIEAIKAGAAAVKELGGAIWDGAKPMVEHGSTELMNGIYNGNAFTPYGWKGVEPGNEQQQEAKPQEHGNAQEQAQEVKPWEQQSAQEQVKEQDKGMEMEM